MVTRIVFLHKWLGMVLNDRIFSGTDVEEGSCGFFGQKSEA